MSKKSSKKDKKKEKEKKLADTLEVSGILGNISIDEKGTPRLAGLLEMPKLSDMEEIGIVGTGTFGIVAVVKDPSNGKIYALKSMRKSDIVKLKQVEHTKNEKHVLTMMTDNPFAISARGVYQDAKALYFLMDFASGGELFTLLRSKGRFSNSHARFYAAQLILAIEKMHAKNIIYRDLKPENVLLTDQGHIQLTDFGFAKVVADKTWTLCGTPEYLAPELITGKGHGKPADWWAVGVFIYEMLSGFPPFFDENPFGIYEKIIDGSVYFPRRMAPHAKDLISQLLEADITKRLGCMHGAVEDIKKHPWFRRVNWDDMEKFAVNAPFVPETSEDVTINFIAYEDVKPLLGPKGSMDTKTLVGSGEGGVEDGFQGVFDDF